MLQFTLYYCNLTDNMKRKKKVEKEIKHKQKKRNVKVKQSRYRP